MPRQTGGARANPAPHFEDFLPAPVRELGENWDVRFHKILSRLDFVEVLPSAEGLGRVPDIARTPIPVILHLIDLNFLKSHSRFEVLSSSAYHVGTALCRAGSGVIVSSGVAARPLMIRQFA